MEHSLQKEEHILEDDYPIYPMYVYIADGVIIRQDEYINKMSVAEYKRKKGYKEIRRCNLFGRKAKLGDIVR